VKERRASAKAKGAAKERRDEDWGKKMWFLEFSHLKSLNVPMYCYTFM